MTDRSPSPKRELIGGFCIPWQGLCVASTTRKESQRQNRTSMVTPMAPEHLVHLKCVTSWVFPFWKVIGKKKRCNTEELSFISKSVPNPRKVVLTVRQESEDPDSDVEIIEKPSMETENQVEPTQELPVNKSIGSTDDNNVEMLDIFELSSSDSNAAERQSASVEPGSISTSPTPLVVTAASSDRLSATATPMPPAVSLPNDTGVEIKAKHARLQKIIKKNLTELRKKLTILTDANAAASVIDLEVLTQFNNKSLQLSLKHLRLINSLLSASRLMRPHIKRRIKACNPQMEASTAVAARCGKGKYYARSLRMMAAHLVEHGMLPEKKQGKGAHHESLLLNPRGRWRSRRVALLAE
ncbi:hypothetical protein DFH07DRAFT_767134 [Mycena maculata]|uniref:Uncharacterized protein n=1 Tax=Mycena maculata TaxID=230809 RepID=A0AAD7K0N5_9AGAR|nr:hypothetical protein DFH07DRAFT_767134 [Mycena maculata]